MSKQTSCSCQLTLALLGQTCRSTWHGCCFLTLLHRLLRWQEPAWLLSCGVHLTCRHFPRNTRLFAASSEVFTARGGRKQAATWKGCNPHFYVLPCSCGQLLACFMPCAFPEQALQAPVWAKCSGEGQSIPNHSEELQDCWISSPASSA